MALSKAIVKAMDAHPVMVTATEGAVPCALASFGCAGMVAPDRIVVWLEDGSGLGNCANFQRHTSLVREAGVGSDAQRLFTWLIGQFQKANPGRVRGDRSPIVPADFRKAAATT